jgi:predicted transposase/invertase (TIGR01784 family)
MPGCPELKRIQKEVEKIGMEKGRKERDVEIAKELIKKGISIEIISETTGLSSEEIERIF